MEKFKVTTKWEEAVRALTIKALWEWYEVITERANKDTLAEDYEEVIKGKLYIRKILTERIRKS